MASNDIKGTAYDYSGYSYDAMPNETYDQQMERLKKEYNNTWKSHVYSGNKPGLDLGDIPLIGAFARPKAREIPKELQEKYPEYYKSRRYTIADNFNNFGFKASDTQRAAIYSHLGELNKRINEQNRLRDKYITKSYEPGTEEIVSERTLSDWQRAFDNGEIDKIIPETEAEDTTINFIKQRSSNKDNSNIYLPKNNETEEQYNGRAQGAMRNLLRRNGINGELQDVLSNGNYSVTNRWNDPKLWRSQEDYKQYMAYYNNLMGHAEKIRKENKYIMYERQGMEEILPSDKRTRNTKANTKVGIEKPNPNNTPKDDKLVQQPNPNNTPKDDKLAQQPSSDNIPYKNRSDETERLSRLADRLNNRQYYSGTRGTTSIGQQVGPAQSAGHYQMGKIETEDMRQQWINRELRALTNKLEREGQAYTRHRQRQLLADISQWEDLDKQKMAYEQLGIPKDKIEYIMKLPTEQRMIAAQLFIGGGAKIPSYLESILFRAIDPLVGRGL